ncbi:unnamed protein product [Closterium sp. Naga37s-1]|nr:unnamed protein product [Closterium sp. Naga37s-1]
MSSSQSSQSDGLTAAVATPPEASGGAPAEPHAGNAQAAKAPYKMPTPEEMAAQEMMNHCGVRTVISGVMGGGMGVMMGLLFGALDQPLHVEEMSTRQQLVHGFNPCSACGGDQHAAAAGAWLQVDGAAQLAHGQDLCSHGDDAFLLWFPTQHPTFHADGAAQLAHGQDLCRHGGDLLGIGVHGGEGEGEA